MSAASLHLASDGLTISVTASVDECAWLAEFFGTDFAAPPERPPLVHLTLAPGFERPAAPLPSDTRLAFALDAQPVRLPVEPHGDRQRLYEVDAGMVYDVDPRARAARLTYDDQALAARVRLMRVVREYFHNDWLRRGHLALHAAGLVYSGLAVAIAGTKGAGKTTALLRLLQSTDARFLSNDRVMVNVSGTPSAHGIPTVVAIRPGTLAVVPILAERAGVCGDFREHASERRARGPQSAVRAGDVVRVSRSQLCDALGSRAEPHGPLASVLFVDPDVRSIGGLRRLDRREAAQMLRDALVGWRSGACVSEVFVTSDDPPPHARELQRRCERLAAQVPCYVGALPLDATHDEATRLLARCVGAEA